MYTLPCYSMTTGCTVDGMQFMYSPPLQLHLYFTPTTPKGSTINHLGGRGPDFL